MLQVVGANRAAVAFYERLGGEQLWEAVSHRSPGPVAIVVYGWREIAALERQALHRR
jgi:hypothetical protein